MAYTGYDSADESTVIYALDVETFVDSDGDGVGDFQGVINRLDYLDRLGVTALWLLPFYETPNLDNGYDVMDYYSVDERLGTLGDFAAFVDAADERGIDVIIDLVMNHTSDQHPWFEAAREDPDSEYRDYYIWKEEKPTEDPTRGSVFPGEVEPERVWSYDEVADAYYYHRFYPFQPDLDLQNSAVREEMFRVMGFWLDLGVRGFRVDAATLMIQGKDPDRPGPEDPHALLREMKHVARHHRGNAILLAEADDDPAHLDEYFGEDDGMDRLMNFVLNAHLIHGLAVESAEPVREGLTRLPTPPTGCTWANFLRNYDELNIGRLSESDKETVFEAFAPEPDMRIYGRGIRRRIAPMLDGDRQQIELAYSLLFSMPGTPLLLYGDEIGMGDDLSLPGRTSVRTPMQWSADPHGGFSDASAEELVRNVIDDGAFAYENVNVTDQHADPDSLLNWFHRLIATHQECRVLERGAWEFVETDADGVLVHRYEGARPVVCAHNLAPEEATVRVGPDVSSGGHGLFSLFGPGEVSETAAGSWELSLDPYGYGWFRAGGI